MKKKILWIIGLSALLLVLFVAAFGNDLILYGMVERLDNAVEQDGQLQKMETRFTCGKLCGNGNGVQYFGTVLVKADTEDAVKALVDTLTDKFEVVGYCVQSGQGISVDPLEHESLSYEHSNFTDGTYFSIYFYNSHSNLGNILDLRGH